jgi:D-glycero-D-manno-heptose 1,7-bisphosphate phosphatase
LTLKKTKVIVLDRDGVGNEDSEEYIKSPNEWEPIKGSIQAIADLTANGFEIVIATNQSGLARGYFSEYDLANIHTKFLSLVEASGGFISAIFYCPHGPGAGCGCRKPKTGLLRKAETELKISLREEFFVGDSMKDLEAAQAFEMRPILVRTGKGRDTEADLCRTLRRSIPIFNDLSAAAKWIINSKSNMGTS